MTHHGLTLIEILIALVILSVGILPIAGMQTKALQANRTATTVKNLTDLAESEIALRQANVDPSVSTCSQSLTGGSCVVTVENCNFNAAADTLTCGLATSTPDAYKVTVSASYQHLNIDLTTVVGR